MRNDESRTRRELEADGRGGAREDGDYGVLRDEAGFLSADRVRTRHELFLQAALLALAVAVDIQRRRRLHSNAHRSQSATLLDGGRLLRADGLYGLRRRRWNERELTPNERN